MILRDSPHRGQWSLAAVRETAAAVRGVDVGGYRAEFEALVSGAAALRGE